MSSAAPTGTNRCMRCSQVATCPWPEPLQGLRWHTEEEALERRIEGAQTPRTAKWAPRVQPSCGSRCI